MPGRPLPGLQNVWAGLLNPHRTHILLLSSLVAASLSSVLIPCSACCSCGEQGHGSRASTRPRLPAHSSCRSRWQPTRQPWLRVSWKSRHGLPMVPRRPSATLRPSLCLPVRLLLLWVRSSIFYVDSPAIAVSMMHGKAVGCAPRNCIGMVYLMVLVVISDM